MSFCSCGVVSVGVQPGIRQVGKYTILDVIGTGGMGIVYRANDPVIGRTVAIKMLRQAEAPGGIFDRFFSREMKSTGNLHHRNIVTVYDSGEQDGNSFLVMEYLEGEPASKLISERRPLPLVEKLDLVIQVCDGLQYAHDRNIIHRDIKPANVIVLSDGTAKIVDFGVARLGGGETSIVTGQLVGSLPYMSPEQINSIPIDARSDVFSTGVMLYELLTYQLPFKGDDAASTFVKILREEPTPLAQHEGDFPPGLQAVVSRALAKSVNDRYQTAEEFGFELLSVQKDLKTASIADCMKRAEAAAHRGDLERAKLHLQEVIRLDRQNERANRLLREVRRAIQQQQRTSQVIQMRSQAQVALAEAQYEEALACADQALRLDPADTESIKLCDEIRCAISRVKAVREALNRAESALLAGDLDDAKEALEESLRLDSSDSEARALASLINKELGERSRRQRVQTFVDRARREIAERKFSDALDALHQAEELDPADSNVHELLQWASRGHEQDKKRLFLQEITDQIEKALREGDFTSSCTISEMGLSRFPDDPTLVRLRAISEKQRDIAERRRFVNEQSVAVKALTEQGKLQEAVQLLTEALEKYRGEPNLESLLANTRSEIERLEFERQEVERQHALERAEAEARAQLTQQVLNWSVELRRSLDARSAIGELRKTVERLRAALDGQTIDEHAVEVASAVLDEFESRLRARDQALAELEQLRRVIERPDDTSLLGESENRLLTVNAAFPHDPEVQKKSAELAAKLSRRREQRDRALASLAALVKNLEQTSTGDLTVLSGRAREISAGFAGDAQIGALLQQIESTVTRRLERHAGLLRELASLSAALTTAHSLEDLARTVERAKSIASQDIGDQELAERSRHIESDVARLRAAIDRLLQEMNGLAQAVNAAPTIAEAEALAPRIKLLLEKKSNFQELQEAAKRIMAGIQGRRIEHDLIVQEMESVRASLSVLESDPDLEAAAARAEQCQKSHPSDPVVHSITAEIAHEVERLLRERADFRARTKECDKSLHVAEEKMARSDWEGALEILLSVQATNPERADLRLQITVARKALEQQRAEQSIETEMLARERAEAEARAARQAMIEQVILTARSLQSEERLDESVQCLRDALKRFPGDKGLQSAISTAEEAAQRRAESEQRERERLASERIARENQASARKTAAELAISEARQFLAREQRDESAQRLLKALQADPSNSDLQTALRSTQDEIARHRAEVERERERQAQLARDKAAEQASRDAHNLLASEQEDRALELVRKALDRDPGNVELNSTLKVIEARAVRIKGERVLAARKKAEDEKRARKQVAEVAIRESRDLLLRKQTNESLQRLDQALKHDPENGELQAALTSTQAEIARQKSAQDRLEKEQEERQKKAREQAESEARTRKAAADKAIKEADKLLADGHGEEAVKRLLTVWEQDNPSSELTAALVAAQGKARRFEEETKRQEKEKTQQEKYAYEQAEVARKLAAPDISESVAGERNAEANGRAAGSAGKLKAASTEKQVATEENPAKYGTFATQPGLRETRPPATKPTTAAPSRNRLIAVSVGVALLLAVGAFFIFRPGPGAAGLPITLNILPNDARVSVDGNEANCPATCAVRMKPGRHTITVQKDGYTAQTQSLTIAESDANRTIALSLAQISAATNPQVSQSLPPQRAQQTTAIQPVAPVVAANNHQAATLQQRPSPNQFPVQQPTQPALPPIASPPTSTPVQVPADVAAWNAVKNTHDVGALRNFRKDFPSSPLTREAYDKMDETTWTSVQNSSQQADFERYINDYPDGHHVADSRERIRAIQKSQEAEKAQEAERARALQQTQQQLQDQAQQRDHELVLQTLDAYRQAYDAKDVNALSAVWITAPRQNLEKVFKLADKIRVRLTQETVNISGDTATVSCHQRLEVTASNKSVNEGIVVFSLKKQQGKWVIESAK